MMLSTRRRHSHLLSANCSRHWLAVLLVALCLSACGKGVSEADSPAKATAQEALHSEPSGSLIVYSSRNEQLIQPVFERYREITGVTIEYATDKAGVLIERLKAEGENTRADLLLTVDAGTLGFAASQGLFQRINSPVVNEVVPAHLRDTDDLWTGLSLRARTIVYSKERVDPAQLSTYAALGDPSWQGRLCLRTSKKVYNQSLVAMLISEFGEQETEQIVQSWVANLAIAPTSNDTQVMQAIINGQCDVGLVNTYYFGRMQVKQPDLPLALYWPNQGEAEGGVHINLSGIGLLKHSKNVAAAKALVDWLVSDEAQAIFAGVNQEYPISSSTTVDPTVVAWGGFKASEQPLSDAYKLQPTAVMLFDRVGYR